MSFASTAAPRSARACLRLVLAAASLIFVSGCASHYVDASLKEVADAQFVRPAPSRPVQLLVEFQTKGVVNARATEQIKPMVKDAVTKTGLFSAVQDQPDAAAATLSVKLDNVPLTDDAAAQGFITGLTFGAKGSQVTDGYVCTVTYLVPGQSQPIVTTARHAIHTTLGASAPPANAVKAASIQEAVETMVRQVTRAALQQLSSETAFR